MYIKYAMSSRAAQLCQCDFDRPICTNPTWNMRESLIYVVIDFPMNQRMYAVTSSTLLGRISRHAELPRWSYAGNQGLCDLYALLLLNVVNGISSNARANSFVMHTVMSHHSAPFEQDLSFRVGSLAHHEHHRFWSSFAVLELDVVIQDKMCEDDLDLVTGKEPSRTRVLSKAEVDIAVADAAELPAVRGLFGLLPHFPEAQTVKDFGFRKVSLVMAKSYLWGKEVCPRW